MANNYTTSVYTTSEFIGDSVSDGNLPTTVDIMITPNSGHTVQASDFFIGSTLPAEVTSVTFTDTIAALDSTNKVKATATLASWYVMPATATSGQSAVVIEIDIDGKTHAATSTVQFRTTNPESSNVTTTVSSSGNVTKTVESDSEFQNAVATNNIYKTIHQYSSAEVCKIVITAASGYFIPSLPSFIISTPDVSKWITATEDKVYNSDDLLTSVTFIFSYSMEAYDVDYSVGETIIFTIPEVEVDLETCISINSAYYLGFNNESLLPSIDTTLQLFVAGSENSTYNIKIQDSVGRTYDFDSEVPGTFNRSEGVLSAQTIYPHSEQLVRGRRVGINEHSITIPYLVRKDTSTSRYFTTTVTPTGDTTSKCDGTDPLVVTLNQFGVVDTTVGITATTTGTNTVSGVIKTLSNQTAVSYPSTFNPTENTELSTYNNGYFDISDLLAYTVNGTVGEGGHSHPSASVVLTATSTALKLQTGDSVTGTGVAADTTITVDGTTTIVLSKTSTTEISGTLVFVRTVGISRQPTQSDFSTATPVVQTGGWNAREFIVTEDMLNSTVVKLDSVTNIVVGLTVQGDNIIGYPTIVTVGSNEIVLSTNQTLIAGDLLTCSNALSEVEITEMTVSGAGTTSCKLNVEGYIKRVGTGDVTGNLILDNFITTYANPTAVVVTATCMLGESISITPIPDCTGHTGTLDISTIPSGSRNGDMAISGDGQSVVYTAPATGTSDSGTYTVNDGINSSSAAAINITLTSF